MGKHQQMHQYLEEIFTLSTPSKMSYFDITPSCAQVDILKTYKDIHHTEYGMNRMIARRNDQIELDYFRYLLVTKSKRLLSISVRVWICGS